MVGSWHQARALAGLLLLTFPAVAQRPTVEATHPAVSFWSFDARTGTVMFAGITAQPQPTLDQQAAHLRGWLSSTCASWEEWQSGTDSTLLFQGQLAGVHPGVVLAFTLRASGPPPRLHYRLFNFRVGAPTGQGLMQWSPLHRLFAEVDFQPDIARFQQQLQRALAGL